MSPQPASGRSRPKSGRTSRSTTKPSLATLGLADYFTQSQRPIAILIFVLPLMLVYEMGVRLGGPEVLAFRLLGESARLLQVYGRGVPAVLLVLTLVLWHIFKHDRWRVNLTTLCGMVLESLLLAIPLLLIGLICQRTLLASTRHSVGAMWGLACGAGVYEEMVFRMFLCGGAKFLLEKIVGVKMPASAIVAVTLSAVLFSLYHYWGDEHFSPLSFVFRAIAGAYFAVAYWYRGFGVTAGTHAFYDIIVISLRRM